MDFTDRVKINIRSGKGGDGHVSFRREKYVANGGPDGGDGGKGGDVIFVMDKGLNTLSDFHYNKTYKAGNGQDGKAKRCAGKGGADLEIRVPEGTLVRDFESGRIIADITGENDRVTVLTGGRGGSGNMHYATSTMQAPKYAQPGKDAKELAVLLELKMIADVGLLGFPNAGKSSLITKVSNARPEIANYPFTTITPHLGVVDIDYGAGFVMADIPGLIEGASDGAGLGHNFLRHIERTKLLIHMVDAAAVDGRNPVEDIEKINSELNRYNAEVAGKRQIIAANKIDLLPDGKEADIIKEIRKRFETEDTPVFAVSTLTGEGIKELVLSAWNILKELENGPVTFEKEFDPDTELVQTAEAYTVSYDKKHNEYVVEGPLIDKMLGYTNLESEKGFLFFQNFLKDNGALERLLSLGIKEGDTVRMYGNAFTFYDDYSEEMLNEADQ